MRTCAQCGQRVTPGASDCAACGAVMPPAVAAPGDGASSNANTGISLAQFGAFVTIVGIASIFFGGWVASTAMGLWFVYAVFEHIKVKNAQKKSRETGP